MRKVVLDTNVLLVSISKKSRLHWVFRKLIQNQYELCITTDILNEYAEIIEQHMGVEASLYTLATIENLSNVNFAINYYQFNLLNDPDDNKFVDCAIASNADFIVSHDKDFDILKDIEFPKVKVIDATEFKRILNKL